MFDFGELTVHLVDWYASLPGCLVVSFLVGHAIHADHATSYHFEQSTGIILHDATCKGSVNYLNLARELLQKNNMTHIRTEDKYLAS